MPLEVRISEPRLLHELMSALLRAGCVAERVSDNSCVVHVDASHSEQAHCEITFFLHAWRLAHPNVLAAVTG
jgi:hypothetical protein